MEALPEAHLNDSTRGSDNLAGAIERSREAPDLSGGVLAAQRENTSRCNHTADRNSEPAPTARVECGRDGAARTVLIFRASVPESPPRVAEARKQLFDTS